jgi:ABC-type dipeptide/oligopeptide/nickel transport system ATPase subunit
VWWDWSVSDDPAPEPAIVARGLTVRGPSGPVFGPLDLDVETGGVTVLRCPAGLGRTALSMTLAGRMRPKSGTLSVLGRTDARAIFAHAALAGIAELDALADAVTVGDVVTEQLRWNAPWYKHIRRAGDDDLARVCTPVFGDLPLPPLRERIEELTELDGLLLRIALADTARPPLLVVGGLDQMTSDADRELLLGRLVALGRDRTVLTADVNGVGDHAVRQVPVALLGEQIEQQGSGD